MRRTVSLLLLLAVTASAQPAGIPSPTDLAALLDQAETRPLSPHDAFEVYAHVGWLAAERGAPAALDRAVAGLGRALAITLPFGDAQAHMLRALAAHAERRGLTTTQIRFAEGAASAQRAHGVSHALVTASQTLVRRGRTALARVFGEAAVARALADQPPDPRLLGLARLWYARALYDDGAWPAAVAEVERLRDHAEAQGDDDLEAIWVRGRAELLRVEIALARNRPAAAERLLLQSARWVDGRGGDFELESHWYRLSAELSRVTGDLETGATQAAAAVKWADKSGDPEARAMARLSLARLTPGRPLSETAALHATLTTLTGPQTKDVRVLLEMFAFLGSLRISVGDPFGADASLHAVDLALTTGQEAFGDAWPDRPRFLAMRAAILMSDGRWAAAAAPLAEAQAQVAATPDSPHAHRVYALAADLAAARGRPAVAIWHGKRAVDALQHLRREVDRSRTASKAQFVETFRPPYVALADRLITAGRLAEARQVLDLLKIAEYEDYTRGPITGIAETAARAPAEARADRRLRIVRGPVLQAAGRRAHLGGRADGLSAAERAELATARERLAVAQRHYRATMEYVEDQLVHAQRAKAVRGRTLDRLDELIPLVTRLGPDVGVLHVVVTPRRLHLILTAKGQQIARSVEVPQASLNREVHRLRQALSNPAAPFEAPAKALYQRLIGPIRGELNAAGVRTLMVSLDAALRYIPLGALVDPDTGRFLVEDFTLARYGARVRGDLAQPHTAAPLRVAALGVAAAQPEFAPLPSVPRELEAIVRRGPDDPDGVAAGTIDLDAAFTRAALRAVLGRSVPVVHVATHFAFRPGADTQSFLVLGDGTRLNMAQLRSEAFDFAGVELLTLSACETAMGRGADGQELDGFGALAHARGAKAVLATLWPVADRSTAALMTHTYSALANGAGRAAALRAAQRAFIDGTVQVEPEGSDTRGLRRPQADSGVWRAPPGQPLRHPYFWAPFILMGDWR